MRGAAAALALSLALAGLACNKGPAEDALGEAERQIAAARPELEAYAPGELEALEAAVRQARAQVAQGRYTDALKAGQQIPKRVRAALAVAVVEKQKRLAAWHDLAGSVSGQFETIATRFAWLVEQGKLPRDMDEVAFAAARTELDSLKRAWSEAEGAFQGGDVPRALRAGRDVNAKAESLAASLGLSTVAPPTPAAPTATPSPPVPVR